LSSNKYLSPISLLFLNTKEIAIILQANHYLRRKKVIPIHV
jgi:hypothetical protein